MAKIVVTETYFNDLIQLKNSANNLSSIKNGLDKRLDNKQLPNLENTNGLYETYERITKLFNDYGKVLEKEVNTFKQAGVNQENIDTAYSRSNQ